MHRMTLHLWVLFLQVAIIVSFVNHAVADPLQNSLCFQQFTQKDGLSSDMVNTIAVRGKQIWFGTYGGGATLYDESKNVWKAYTTKGEPIARVDDGDSITWKNLLAYNHVSVIVPDVDRIWFGTYFYGFGGGGISYYHFRKKPPWKRFNTNRGRAKKVVSIAVDGERLWVGSEKGLSVLDKKTEEWMGFHDPQHGLSGNFVNAILVRPDFIWVGTNGGISRLDKRRGIWKTYANKEGLIVSEIKALAQVGRSMWAGGADGSLFEYTPIADRWNSIESADPLKNGGMYSIAVTNDKVFICRDNGVSVYDRETMQWGSLTTSDGLLSSTVFCAAEDGHSIWFGTDRGVSRLLFISRRIREGDEN